jgi:AraC family cel operon transcriptional repressor
MSDKYFSKNIGFNFELFENAQIIPDHIHDYYEFFVILSGRAIHTINGETQILSSGSLYFIRPNDYHSFKSISNESFKIINMTFSVESVNDYSSYIDNSEFWDNFMIQKQIPFITLTQVEIDELFKNLNMTTNIQKGPKGFTYLNRSLLSFLFYKLLFADQQNNQNSILQWFDTLILSMQQKENFVEGIPALIRISGKSHEYLCRSFQKYLQCSPVDYINFLRLKYAEFILVNTRFPILDISLECGFNNLSHFNHKFKEAYHCSPSEYRKQNKELHVPSDSN